ncbi:MAG: hypothetical protein AB1502_02910 [Thermodesulfobacteriota bacterium]
MNRSNKGQVEHDREVGRVANEYLRKGYTVLADLPGWEQPETIKGLRPDLRARKKGHETLIEIETPESVESARDKKQKRVSNGADAMLRFTVKLAKRCNNIGQVLHGRPFPLVPGFHP